MKGIILAGGSGKRLYPLTKVINKHLLPVYSKPMIYYPIETLVTAGIKELMIVTGRSHARDFIKQLGKPKQLGLKSLTYAYQKKENGIAAALSLAENFARGEKIVVVLGDNIIEKSIKRTINNFEKQPQGARVLIKKVPDPKRFGVVETKRKKIISLEEKPRIPKSNHVVTGIYMYDHKVFDIIRSLKYSKRGELEITDVNKAYLQRNELYYEILEGWWLDSGTFDSLLAVSELVAREQKTKKMHKLKKDK